jgi:hypothetical protein
VSKARAQRRAAREAQVVAARAARERALTRQARRRAIVRRIVPDRLTRRPGRVGHLYLRRSAGQRAVIVGVAAVLVLLVWTSFDSLATRIALTLALVVATPALVVVAFGRRHDRR